MSPLERLVPMPRLVEEDSVELAIPPESAWEIVRHGDLGRSPLVRGLFAMRTAPSRLLGKDQGPAHLRIDELVSTPDVPGFQILVDGAREVAVGAIGQVWKLDIPFVHVDGAAAFAEFDAAGYVKVAWSVRVSPYGDHGSRVTIELRVDATDERSWRRFRRYFALVGPGSHFIRRAYLSALAREHGTPEARERERVMPGDELLPGAAVEATHGVTIRATPEAVWPWIVQMGARRAGFYGMDVVDNSGERSADEVHPELQRLAVGDVITAVPGVVDGFEVLRFEPGRLLVLGGLYDMDTRRRVPFLDVRPRHYWQATWTFFLESLGDDDGTRLHVRGRASFSPDQLAHARWLRFGHAMMQRVQLRRLAARVEGRMRADGLREIARGVGGGALVAVAMLTPFLRGPRSHWGLPVEDLARDYPGDDLVEEPRWSWAHAVEVDAPVDDVWPWVAQIGATRAGFYSYQWLENLVGCGVRNAEAIHPEWAVKGPGDVLVLHPDMPPLPVVRMQPGRWFVAFAGDPALRGSGKPWVEASWLLMVEPTGAHRCRFVSRYRAACSDDLATRLAFGPALYEPVGFVMDRRMLLGVKARAERRAHDAASGFHVQARAS